LRRQRHAVARTICAGCGGALWKQVTNRGRGVAILGATGGTGSAMLHRSVAAGDEFTVPVRDRSH
ncbi:MAG: hypothetical protein ACKO2D_07640, partial [Chloroflexota bacterium]